MENLASDIAANGQHNPIVLYQGQMLDVEAMISLPCRIQGIMKA
jgi:hypothetical protein